MTTEQIFQAVCGQRCGPVTVASLDVKNCPQCGHPLTTLPQSPGTTLGAPPIVPAQTIAGAPIVEVPLATDAKPADVPATDEAEAPGAAALDPEANLAHALELVGFSANEAKDAAHDAVTEIARRKAATS